MESSSASHTTTRQVHAFLASIERAFKARRIYSPQMAGYAEAMRFVETTLPPIAEIGGFTVRVTATELLLGRESVLSEPRAEDSFFYPFYRDGVRALSFGAETTVADIEGLLGVVEAEREGRVGYSDDTVGLLWRQGLGAVAVETVDPLPREAEEGQGRLADRLAEIAGDADRLLAAARSPSAICAEGDASSPLPRPPADPPSPLSLQPVAGEVETLLAAAAKENQHELLGRFVRILAKLVEQPDRPVAAEQAESALGRVLESYWTVADYAALGRLLELLQAPPSPGVQSVATGAAERFASADRIAATLERVQSEDLELTVAEQLWKANPEAAWTPLFQYWFELKEGEQKARVAAFLRRCAKARPFPLKSLLRSPQAQEARAAVGLLDDDLEALLLDEIRGLASHTDAGLREKGIGLAVKHMGDAAFDLVWRSVQDEQQESVRLLAVRHLMAIEHPQLPQRLVQLISSSALATRPSWERKKYVALLGQRDPARALKLFESWMPSRRSFLRKQDLEVVELALFGIAHAGDGGLQRVQETASGGGKVGKVAEAVLSELSKEAASR